MGRKKHLVTVSQPGAAGLAQLCMLVPSWCKQYGEWEPWYGFETIHAVYPILFDHVTRKFKRLSTVSFPCEYMYQSALASAPKSVDKDLYHCSAHGRLHPYYKDCYPIDTNTAFVLQSDPDDVLAERAGIVLSGDEHEYVPFDTYELDTYNKIGTFGPLWTEFTQSWEYQDSRNDLFVGPGRVIIMGSISGSSDITEYLFDVPEEFESSNLQITLDVTQHYKSDYQEFSNTRSVAFQILPVSPLFMCPSGSLAHERWIENTFPTKILHQVSILSEAHREREMFEAVLSAANAFKELNFNGIAFLRDLQELKTLLEPILKLLRNKTSPAAWASLLLSIKYGIMPTKDDLYNVFNAIKSLCSKSKRKALRKALEAPQTRYGTRFDLVNLRGLSVQARYNSRVRGRLIYPESFSTLDVLLQEMGVCINAKNVWDLVPFSFVINWFTNLDDLLRQIDYQFDIMNLQLRDHVVSSKFIARPTRHGLYDGCLEYRGPLVSVRYSRAVTNYLPSPPWGVDAASLPWKHVGELFLLAIQRIGK